MARLRRVARIWTPLFSRKRWASSRRGTSRTQCQLFSIDQRWRMALSRAYRKRKPSGLGHQFANSRRSNGSRLSACHRGRHGCARR